MNKAEIKSLTGIRGVAAVYVIIFHWYNHLFHTQPVVSFTPMGQIGHNFIKHGYLAVDLFFSLSAFVLCIASYKLFSEKPTFENYKMFIIKRFFRLFPVYIVLTFLYSLWFDKSSLTNLLINLTLFQGIIPSHSGSIVPPGWSLTNEWVICFVFPFFLYYAVKFRKNAWMLVVMAVAIIILISFVRAHALNWSNSAVLDKVKGFNPNIGYTRGPSSFGRTIASFFLGIFAFLVYKFKDHQGPYFKYLGYLSAPILVLLFVKSADVAVVLLMPILILYVTQANFLNRFLSSKPVHFAGAISYSLYLSHFFFINTYDSVAALLKIDSRLFSLSYVLIATFVFSTITYYCIEKPGIALFKPKPKHKTATNIDLLSEQNKAPAGLKTS
ncbi:acyltransferase [Mucilaginibacter sabulilitoris]|uniref:Acyltransferase n=1 Tax=Mucilaginibacter sabulilitoris TaxID=1173583 RepID=A0ABZ0TUP4_9SPHI|nr:acyltransferase [Mucilaginibacter sabulilitoris]WPU95873.1 acyltransferase [Mucilaginibacter sabulilitoris]